MNSFVPRPSLASCSLNVDGDAEFCYRLFWGVCNRGIHYKEQSPPTYLVFTPTPK